MFEGLNYRNDRKIKLENFVEMNMLNFNVKIYYMLSKATTKFRSGIKSIICELID